jgi:mono/diheme cytochrome c family protein
VVAAWLGVPAAADAVRFDRDIRPLLAEHCFACHGPDAAARQADLRLDTAAGATADRDGSRAIVAGNPQASAMVTRIRSTDPDVVMPPPHTKKTLSAAERDLLERWIAAGATFEEHWAWRALARPEPPAAGHPVDAFIDATLAREGLTAQGEADRDTLIRRLSFDLTGLPPEPEAIDAFRADRSPDAWERLVDRTLASPHHAERLAAWWLDLVRYADSVGYHGDQVVSMWPYRDWVIGAFRDNMPFDRFTREQLAGDLLPGATHSQRVAAAYNRLNMMSAEGGGQDKEYHAKYAGDRVRAASGAWLGATLGCAECHDHKFDPFTTRDFYAFAAFFADVAERGIYHGANADGTWGEMMRLPTPAQAARQRDLEALVAAARQRLQADTPELVAERAAWIAAAAELLPAGPDAAGKPAGKAALPEPVAKALRTAADKRSPDELRLLADHHRGLAEANRPQREELARLEADLKALVDAQPRMPITVAVAPRTVRVLPRGNWMDDSGAVVLPATPAFLPAPARVAAPPERLTRLDLAAWLTARDNPLVSRVLANRLWALCFGQGLSRRLDDHGAQGEPPSHPDLLDWLACELRDGGGGGGPWDLRHLLRTVVTSRAYRRAAAGSGDLVGRDPDNRLLARQVRYRVDAETVRDTALAAAGLLVRDVGGPSVKPYQPEGYWDYLNFPKRAWQADAGEPLWRRGLYVHWQRQYLHPALLVFDAPSREECTARRPRTSTPLQALVLLNDPSFVEAARALAARALAAADTPADRATFMLRRAVGRVPPAAEVAVLVELAGRHQAALAAEPAAADQLLAVGTLPLPTGVDRLALAAWTSAARAVLNLQETFTRP